MRTVDTATSDLTINKYITMKFFSNLKSGFVRAAAVILMAAPVAVSCFDSTELQEQIDMLVDKVFELEERLNNELDALAEMMDGNAMISSVIVGEDGITTIKLSTGAEFKLYPQQNMQSFITYMQASIDGKNVDCWAYIDDKGIKRYMRDAEGNPIPVPPVIPETDEEKREYREAITRRQYRDMKRLEFN